MSSLKIVAGLGSIDDYEDFVKAGADELFCGYVPGDYYKKFGRNKPLNRREVIFYNVQIGSLSELLILSEMIKINGVPVSITLNSTYYDATSFDYIKEMVGKLIQYGFSDFIVAVPELIEELSKIENINLRISGEMGEFNRYTLDGINMNRVVRVIFPRQTTIGEMRAITENSKGRINFEAFVLNEKCHFTGAYCNSLHCDELGHMCRVNYALNGKESACADREYDGFGASGCGICKLWKLRDAGISHVKVVSRGNDSGETVRDIKLLKKAIEILDESENEESFINKAKKLLFPEGCSENCYCFSIY